MKKIFLAFLFAVALQSLAMAQGYKPESVARNFNLKNIDGKMLGLNSFPDAKGAIVIFSCNHCPFVKAYESRMEALNKKYAAKGYPVVAINSNDVSEYPDDSFENMQLNAKEKGFTFPYLIDESQEIAKTYGALKTPHVYVLQKKGNEFVVKYIGAIDDSTEDANKVQHTYVADAVDALLAGKSVKIPTTKAIGCGIKWKK